MKHLGVENIVRSVVPFVLHVTYWRALLSMYNAHLEIRGSPRGPLRREEGGVFRTKKIDSLPRNTPKKLTKAQES
jgi:hypothetical protein